MTEMWISWLSMSTTDSSQQREAKETVAKGWPQEFTDERHQPVRANSWSWRTLPHNCKYTYGRYQRQITRPSCTGTANGLNTHSKHAFTNVTTSNTQWPSGTQATRQFTSAISHRESASHRRPVTWKEKSKSNWQWEWQTMPRYSTTSRQGRFQVHALSHPQRLLRHHQWQLGAGMEGNQHQN